MEKNEIWDPRHIISTDVASLRIVFVNIVMVGEPGGPWVLVDAGLIGSAGKIKRAAESRYGKGAKPEAIILTHGHFDHVGALHQLAMEWDVPVYAHPMELPFLTGINSYPPPDPSVGGGAMAYMSWLFPNTPIKLGDRVHALPEDGSIPHMPGWRWIHTPGHAPGHVSFFRERDRALIAGDAFVTVKQESAIAVIQQRQEVHGPPSYFTIDWPAARRSVRLLAALKPSVAITGHGIPMWGEPLQNELQLLADNFDVLALPLRGRYVNQAAYTDEQGVVILPPAVANPVPKVVAGIALGALIGFSILKWVKSRKQETEHYYV